MKHIFTLLLLGSIPCGAWETTSCGVRQSERIEALNDLGKLAASYENKNGAIPDLCNVTVPEIEENIPEILKDYLVCGSSEYDEIYYSCWLERSKQKEIIETCTYKLSSGEVQCGGMTAEYDEAKDS